MPLRLSENDVKIYFESIGCKLVSSYITNKKPLQYLCSCGNSEIQTNTLQAIKRGFRCPKCRIERLKKTNKERHGYEFTIQRPDKKESMLKGILKYIQEKKHTFEELKIYYKEQGCELLENKYNNVLTPMRFICVCGKEAINNFDHFIRGRRCSYKECVDKRKIATNYKKFGTHCYTKTAEYCKRRKETCLRKYGVEYPSQSPEIQEKIEKSAYTFKPYMLPSGIVVNIQGYEHFALDLLLKTHNECDIKIGRMEQPEIWWIDDEGKQHRYFSDFYIPSINTIIEVKSTWTYKTSEEKLKIIKPTCEALGYTFLLWIFNEKGILCNSI